MFSRERANLHCEFIEELPHVEGRWASPNIRLEPAQTFFVVQLFGFRNHDGRRRFTVALYAVARKNAKSTLAAALLLSCFCLEAEVGPQVVSAATTGSQARIVWGVAKRMVERTADMCSEFQLEAFANSIARYENGGAFKPINAKASTQDGLNPSHTVLDELHAHKSHDLLNVLTSAAGARANPLWLYTTTEGYENPGPWAEQRSFAKQVLEGILPADHFLALYYTLDDEDDDFDETKWVKANPLIDVNPLLLTENRKLATEAKAMPGRLAEFRIKRLNRQSATAQGWIDLGKWKACGKPVVLDDLIGKPCWAGLDLAATTDMAACWYVWEWERTYYAWGRYWVPEAAVRARTERKTVPYEGWVSAGHITMTQGDVIDTDVVERDMVADFARFKPRQIAYDPWNATDLVNRLTTEGLSMVLFIQGPKSYHPAMTFFERQYRSGRFRHGGNPVLTWNAANLVPRRDVNLNMAPDRKRSADKIDGMVAVLMAMGLAAIEEDTASPYQDRGLLII